MLSILIPTFNYSVISLVKKLQSQASYSEIAYEIIVLDDQSTDIALLEENLTINDFENCTFRRNEVNLGRTFTRKTLAEMAQYSWLLFLDADVFPVSENYIRSYILEINKGFDVVVGGYQYENTVPDSSKTLRYKYGKVREEKKAALRSQRPYHSFFSGNFLIRKSTFLTYNYPIKNDLYGLDNYFAYQLYSHAVPVKHIDNSIYHLGLESNEVFFTKSLSSLDSRIALLANQPGIEKLDVLIKYYNFSKRTRLNVLLSLFFKITEPVLKRFILRKNPSLLCFDLYRLGYICSLSK